MSSTDNPMNRLIGLTVTEANKVHDYLQLRFGDSATLNINNKYKLSSGAEDIECVTGHAVLDVKANALFIEIVFIDSCSLIIGLGEDDYNGPEAVEMYVSGCSPIIWN